jgi:hypothetical protein
MQLTNKTAALNSSILKQIDQIQQVSWIVGLIPLVKDTSGLKVPKNDLEAIDLLKTTGSFNRTFYEQQAIIDEGDTTKSEA